MGAVLACSFRRLHIAPFTAELEDRIIAPSVKPFAREVSFHAKPTFPERAFGFVELPEMEAEKLKKKFNGSTLRGQKVRVEDARPERKRKSDEEDEQESGGKARKVARRDKKRREEGVLSGVELEDGRSVKRGWTEKGEDGKSAKGKGKESKSQAAEGEVDGKKLRFKTTIPPNASAPEEGKGKKKKETDSKSNKKVVVEEFTKSKKVLVTSGEDGVAPHGELSYQDGKGWIDQSGNVVEAERPSRRPSRRKATKESEPTIGAIESTESNDFAHADGMAIDDEAGESSKVEATDPDAVGDQVEAAKEVHPLEALFKRPTSSSSNSAKSRPKPINTSFSFFDTGAGEEDADMEGAVPPKTPNTRRDFEWRSIRSAAPTPDTAAIGRKFSFPFASGDDEEDDSDDDADMDDANQAESGATQGPSQGDGEESAFRKWFYEHRGEFNRGWKKRRREEKKAKRQRENRRLSRRVA